MPGGFRNARNEPGDWTSCPSSRVPDRTEYPEGSLRLTLEVSGIQICSPADGWAVLEGFQGACASLTGGLSTPGAIWHIRCISCRYRGGRNSAPVPLPPYGRRDGEDANGRSEDDHVRKPVQNTLASSFQVVIPTP